MDLPESLLFAIERQEYIILETHPTCSTLNDFYSYLCMHGIVEAKKVNQYLLCMTIARRLSYISPVSDNDMVLKLYRLYTSNALPNLTIQERRSVITWCVIVRGIWMDTHPCQKIQGKCECTWTLSDIIRILEDLLMEENNNRIGKIGLVWEERRVTGEQMCMTTWLPREMVEDVIALLGNRSLDTLVVRA